METRPSVYVEPKREVMSAFLQELKEKDEGSKEVRLMFHERFSSLLNAASPHANQLFIAGLLWLAESDEPALDETFLHQGLGINDGNPPPDNKQKVIYFARLAKHVKATEKPGPEAKGFTFKDDIVKVASRVLEQIQFEPTPDTAIEKFQEVAREYREIKRGEGFFKRVISATAPEREDQQFVIETMANLCLTLSNGGVRFEYDAVMKAAALIVMHQIEQTYSRENGGGELYALLQLETGVEHTSQVPFEDQKRLFDQLIAFIDKTTNEQWYDARPEHAANFDIVDFRNKMRSQASKVKLCDHKPQSLPSFVVGSTCMAIAAGVLYAKSFAWVAIAKKLHTVWGVGKNSFILALASQGGDKLKSVAEQLPYVGKVSGFFAKQGALAVGEAAEEKATTFSLTNLPQMFYGWLSSSGSKEEAKHGVYRPNLDPFQALIGLKLMHAREKNEASNVEFLQEVLDLHEMLPDDVKKRLAEKAKQKDKVLKAASDGVEDTADDFEHVIAEEVEGVAASSRRGLGLSG